jgi:hypothetical protein
MGDFRGKDFVINKLSTTSIWLYLGKYSCYFQMFYTEYDGFASLLSQIFDGSKTSLTASAELDYCVKG